MLPSNKRLLIVLLLIVVFWFVCSFARRELFWPQPEKARSSTGDLGLELWVSQDQVNAGDTVDIRFTVDNCGDKKEVIELEDKLVMDILIDSDTPLRKSVPTTRWSEGREIMPEMKRL
jgi:hypothetical protein